MTIPKTVHFLPFMLRRSDGLAGATRSMVTLCSELNRRGEVVIVTLEDDALAEHARSAGVETISLAPPSGFDHGRVGSIVRAARAIRGVAKDLGADLVHAHSAPACRFAWPAAASLGVPLVSHQRDIYKNNNFHRGLGRARHVIAISHWVQSTLAPRIRARSTVVHNAVRLPDPADVVDPSARGIGPDRPLRIGFAGRLKPEKGADLLTAAAPELLGQHADTELHVWGVPPEGEGDEHAASVRGELRHLADRFPGRVRTEPFRRDVETFYRSMDVVVIPSRFAEPFGRVSIEAMAYGAAVVAAGHGGLAEVVRDGETGLTFAPDDSADLLDKLRSLAADDALRERLALAGLRLVREEFTAERHADRVLEVYRGVLA